MVCLCDQRETMSSKKWVLHWFMDVKDKKKQNKNGTTPEIGQMGYFS